MLLHARVVRCSRDGSTCVGGRWDAGRQAGQSATNQELWWGHLRARVRVRVRVRGRVRVRVLVRVRGMVRV